MLIEGDGLVATLGQWADNYDGYVASTGSEVEGVSFVEHNEKQTVFLELRALNERVNVGLTELPQWECNRRRFKQPVLAQGKEYGIHILETY